VSIFLLAFNALKVPVLAVSLTFGFKSKPQLGH
jgi:hypothetical protein